MNNHLLTDSMICLLGRLLPVYIPKDIRWVIAGQLKYHDMVTIAFVFGLKPMVSPEYIGCAIDDGYLSILKWRYTIDASSVCDGKYVVRATMAGHVDILKWFNNIVELNLQTLMHFAMQFGHCQVVQWLHSKGAQFVEVYMDSIIKKGHTDVFKYMLENNYIPNVDICALAAEYGQLEILQCALAAGAWYDNRMYSSAHQHVIDWLVENGYEESAMGCSEDYGDCV